MASLRDVSSLANSSSVGYTYVVTFDDNDFKSQCNLDMSVRPIECPRGVTGDGQAMILVSSITVTHAVVTIAEHLHNNIIEIPGQPTGTLLTVPDTCGASLTDVLDNLNRVGMPFALQRGRIRYTGTRPFYIALERVDQYGKVVIIPHTIINILGFQNAQVLTFGRIRKAVVFANHLGSMRPDTQGPTRDILVICDQAKNTTYAQQVVAFTSPNSTPGTAFTRDCSEYARELDVPSGTITKLTFRLEDAAGRLIKFELGVPIMLFRILPLTQLSMS